MYLPASERGEGALFWEEIVSEAHTLLPKEEKRNKERKKKLLS